LAKRESAECDAALDPFFRNPFNQPRERVAEGREFPFCPFAESRAACSRTFLDEPRFGGGSLIPARRAFDNPIAMACCGDAAPCFPSRI